MSRIMIVDDKEENVYYLETLLAAYGHTTEAACHGGEALVKARKNPPDLVISDLLMPVMDGYTLLWLWKADTKLHSIPFIVYTATYTNPEDQRLAISLGADAFILKPSDPDVFMARIQEAIGHTAVVTPKPSRPLAEDEKTLLRDYSETLIRKLEEKTLQLEDANRALQEDIAERKRSENELRWKTAFLQAQVDSDLDGVLVVTPEGRKILQNQRMNDLWKIPPEIAQSENDEGQIRFVADRTRNPALFIGKVAYLNSHPGEVSREEVELVDGSVFDRYSAPVQDSFGVYYGRIWTFRDVTAERKREAELAVALEHEKELSEKARAGERAKSEFLAVMSHEIRTPLNGILGFAELLARKPGLPEEARSHARTIAASGEALLHVLDDVLDLSRIEAGRMHIERTTFSPRDLLEGTRQMLAPLASGKNLLLEISVDSSIPPLVTGDSARTRQILLNLAGNAVKFTEHGCITLGLRQGAETGWLEFFVADTGPGIPSGQMEKIFHPFTQGDSSLTRPHGGAGLGLAISRRLAELMSGTLSVRSEPGCGAEFLLALPLAEAAEPAPQAQEPPSFVLDAGFAAAHPLRVLVVEDDKINLRLIVTLLQRLGYEPLSATNGREAVEIHRDEKPDCIFMDLQMPEMDGIEATRSIRAAEADSDGGVSAFIAAFTANIIPADRQCCFDVGMNGYLNKPVKLAAIAATLVEAAGLRESCLRSGAESLPAAPVGLRGLPSL